jgi:hypothetical protein
MRCGNILFLVMHHDILFLKLKTEGTFARYEWGPVKGPGSLSIERQLLPMQLRVKQIRKAQMSDSVLYPLHFKHPND